MMKGFLGKFFGKKAPAVSDDETLDLLSEILEKIISISQFDLEFALRRDEQMDEIVVELFGADEELLTGREGQLLDSFQLYLKRVLQHQMADEKANIVVDANGFREQANQTLIELAEKLKSIAMDRGKPVYFRALPPRDRKVIHQYLASDDRVKSRSIGDGLYKKIKIYPTKVSGQQQPLEQPIGT